MRKVYPFFYGLIFLVLNLPTFAQENIVFLNDSTQVIDLREYVEILEDPNGKLTIKDVKSPKYQLLFEKDIAISPAVQAYWIRFRVQNQLSHESEWLLEFAPWDYVHIFFEDPNSGADSLRETGTRLPMAKRDVPLSLRDANVFLRLPLSNKIKSTYQTFYIRVEGFAYSEPNLFPKIYDKTHILEMSRQRKYFQGVYIGIILVMALYNLMIFFSVKDFSYFYYVLYLVFLGFIFIIDSGDGMELLWSDYPLFNRYVPFYAYALVLIFNTLFTKNYLNARINAPLGNKILNIFIYTITVLSVIVFMIQIQVYYFIFYVLVVLTIIINTSVAISCIQIGYRPAKYYLTANINLFIGLLVALLYIYGEYYWEAHTAVQIGSALEAIVFSLGLADRINTLKREKSIAQEVSILQLKENERLKDKVNRELEEKVAQRTLKIEKQNEEILLQRKSLEEQNKALEKASESLIEQAEALQRSSLKITDSIRYAESIQKALLPSKTDLDHIFDEHFIIYLPKDYVSGDFYWSKKIKDKVFFLIADSTGHGVPAGFISTLAIAQLNEIVGQQHENPNQILKQLHHQLRDLLRQDEKRNEDALDIALCVFEENYYSGDKRLSFVGAKRHLWYVQYPEGNLYEIRGERFSVGGNSVLEQAHQDFTLHQLTLRKGDVLYLMTDGFIDQSNGQNRKFGSKKLKALISDMVHIPLYQQQEALLAALQKHQQQTPQRDDITLIGIRI